MCQAAVNSCPMIPTLGASGSGLVASIHEKIRAVITILQVSSSITQAGLHENATGPMYNVQVQAECCMQYSLNHLPRVSP